jgi:hypothetical protein
MGAPAKATTDGFEPIVSSNLESAKFEGDAIVVRFKNGTAYRYPGCDQRLWNEFRKTFDGKNGRSAGKFHNAQIRPKAYEKIDDWK